MALVEFCCIIEYSCRYLCELSSSCVIITPNLTPNTKDFRFWGTQYLPKYTFSFHDQHAIPLLGNFEKDCTSSEFKSWKILHLPKSDRGRLSWASLSRVLRRWCTMLVMLLCSVGLPRITREKTGGHGSFRPRQTSPGLSEPGVSWHPQILAD